jgi:hypothetical protein
MSLTIKSPKPMCECPPDASKDSRTRADIAYYVRDTMEKFRAFKV